MSSRRARERSSQSDAVENDTIESIVIKNPYIVPVDAVLHPTFIPKLCYKLPCIVTFTFIQTFDQNFVFFTEWRHVDRHCDA